jgi:hypothetical protein
VFGKTEDRIERNKSRVSDVGISRRSDNREINWRVKGRFP